MSAAENCALMRRWFEEVWNQGRLQTITDLMDENCTAFGQAGDQTEFHGPASFVAFAQRFRAAFPDIKITVEDAFGEGDSVAVRWSAEMTHKGDDLGLPATNRKAHVTGMTMARFKNGKVISGWDNWDQLALMRQLGVVPEEQRSELSFADPEKSRGQAGA